MELTHACKKIIAGWREWIALPELGIERIKAKVDTGARTSTLHAFALAPYQENGKDRIRFNIHPIQKDDTTLLNCEAGIFDHRWVTDSGGHRERRFVIKTPLIIGGQRWTIEMTLTNRDAMGFRMLLGRTALEEKITVDPSQSYLLPQDGMP